MLLLYLPTKIYFPIGGGRVACGWSKLAYSLGQTKLTNSLGKQRLEISTRTWSGRTPLNLRWQIFVPTGVQQRIFSQLFFPTFKLEGVTKHLMTSSAGNSEFCYPLTSMFKRLGETKLAVSLVASH